MTTLKQAISQYTDKKMKYQIYNRRTKQNIGQPYICKKRARNRAHKLDLEYGAYAYGVIEISLTDASYSRYVM